MSFATYSALKTTIAGYLARSDLSTQISDFVTFAENRLRRELRIRQMLKVATALTTSGDSTVGLPSDFLEIRDVYLQTTPVQSLTYVSPSGFSRTTRITDSGKPTNYTILASEFQFSPVPDSEYTVKMLYFAKPDYLSDSNTTNVFLEQAPDALLYAALLEAEPYLFNDARVNTWGTLYDRAIATLTRSDEASQYSGVPLSMKLA